MSKTSLAAMPVVTLKPGADAPLRRFYPWVRRDDVQSVAGDAAPGEVVRVQDVRGFFVAQGFYNAQSHIPLRIISLEQAAVDAAFFRARIRDAVARRAGRIANTNAWRVVYGESDNLPGLVVDRFGDVLVMQVRNAGIERYKPLIVAALAAELAPRGIYERSDVEAREDEGLPETTGTLWGDVPAAVEITEDDVRWTVGLAAGQKTGFYLDQRDNRRLLRGMVRPGDRVLDVYSYVGSFGLHAARAGAQVLCVDKDATALGLAEQAARRNDVGDRVGVRWGDALEVMQSLDAEKRRFTHIVLDPPTLVKRREDLPRAKRLFVNMTANALRLLEPGGTLLLSSCAFYVSLNDLLDAARQAANETHRRVEVTGATFQPADHLWILQVAETLYLKSIFLRAE
ncbi:MAG: class I SAM-dependent rRNA methyltransferase [Chloroflexi bacterium]|nr:class I SAM-dependent rRNA methyltransferase [Chloroflexota bacterium]